MADLADYGNTERDIEQALVALKKGAHLIKYSRKGKPKFCPFRISADETTLIWLSHKGQRNLDLSSVSKIIPGQRTAVFRRYPCAEKDFLSFSLLYKNGNRSLDLICKEKVEVEVWFSGLKALISTGQHSRRTRSCVPDFNEAGDLLQDSRRAGAALEISFGLPPVVNKKTLVASCSSETPLITGSDASDRANMQLRTGDGFRLSVSSSPSCSSQGSGPDDIDSLGDIYVWGAVWCDGSLSDGFGNSYTSKTDVLLPKPLESNVVLDVHQISCGVRNASLVTRQGEVFTWGEESGGRLGHGIDKDFSRPRLVEFLAVNNVDSVACGEYHTCAISVAGDLFTWGDGTHNAGLLGHTTDVSHWIPKRIYGPLDGLQVLSVACGTWHTALITSSGKLFTFGDGAFGVLGHGNCESFSFAKEVESLSGLKTIKVACGLWHTAAIVEVMGQNSVYKRLFTWGDGDKNRLGHGDKEMHLIPTCVRSLADYDFQQVSCGHNITVALTVSGHVFTMGSTAHGQLGNPLSDGKLPCLVQDKLVGQTVEEISCGSFHVTVLTSRSEVFTWGKGANGRLGHGDIEDRKGPTLVEALKDRLVKSISCGSNFTAGICIHKWVSGADQSFCSGCRLPFSFTRKRHNCYNCGLVYCHACSSKRALQAALAPTPGKPHRVCDPCYAKLKASEAGTASNFNRNFTPWRSIENRERFDVGEMKSSKILLSPSMEPMKYNESKSVRSGMKSDPIIRNSQVPSLLLPNDTAFPSTLGTLPNGLKPVMTSTPQPPTTPRSASPNMKKPSPPRAAGAVFSKSIIDSFKKTNELLNQEVTKLQNQVKSLRQKCEAQDVELQKSHKSVQEAASLAEEKFSKCRVAKEVIKSVTKQLKEMSEKLPPEVFDSDNFKALYIQMESFLEANKSFMLEAPSSFPEGSSEANQNMQKEPLLINKSSDSLQHESMDYTPSAMGVTELSKSDKGNVMPVSNSRKTVYHESPENGSKSPRGRPAMITETERQVIEQFEPGVYVTVLQLQNGIKVFKRVKFSKRKFNEQQAAEWWRENGTRVLQKYSHQERDSASTGSSVSAATDAEEDVPPSS